MKTKIFITATLILAASFICQAAPNKKMLTIFDQMGRELLVPIKMEKEVDTLPFDTQSVFRQNRLNELNQVFDLSGIIQPEAEVDDIPFNLREIFESTTK